MCVQVSFMYGNKTKQTLTKKKMKKPKRRMCYLQRLQVMKPQWATDEIYGEVVEDEPWESLQRNSPLYPDIYVLNS